MKIIQYKPTYYTQVHNIYEKSFPQEEKYITLDDMLKIQNTEFYCLLDNNTVIGFIYLIFYKDMIFILYLAIDTQSRSKGCGSYLLKWCLDKYGDKKIFLNIEEVKEGVENYKIRKRRLDFYLKNGFFITNYVSNEELENFNILSNNSKIDINEYKILDKVVAEILNEPTSNIIQM